MPLISSPTHPANAQYSAVTGLTYVFNVIVGTGALAIPAASSKAGYVLSSLALLSLSFVSYVTVTFVIETMAIANAILLTRSEAEDQEPESSEDEPLINETSQVQHQQILCRASFDISRTVEMGQMAKLFFKPFYITLFYVTLTVYLYGDLAIYITAVSKSLRDLTCMSNSTTCIESVPSLDPGGLYRLYAILFIIVVGPFVFIGIQKTRHLQLTTTLLRWIAFTTMIVISIKLITIKSHEPVVYDFKKLPNMFGVSVYSFMCHHSLPSLVTPIRNKKQIHMLFFLDYCLIATFYILLSVTGVFAFEHVKDLYTLNFIGGSNGFVSNLLALFPVFTLSTNFPIIAITLKNNLKTLFNYESEFSNVFYSLLAILPPFLVSVFVEDISFLVNFTGSFAGAGIQYIIPISVCYLARKSVSDFKLNPYKSAFESSWWFVAVFIWCFVAVGVVICGWIFAY